MESAQADLLAYIFEGLFYIATLIFVIFSSFLVYHWFAYGTKRRTSMIALAVYLLGSAPLFIVMAVSLTLLK